jgi:glycosyltransferase involved in cell wall biosynthesis
MKALLLDQFSDPGGAQQGLLDLLPGLHEHGWTAAVGLPGHGELFHRIRALGFPVERIDCGPFTSGRKSAVDLARFLAQTPRLAWQLRALAADADVVYINGPRLLPAAALARLRAPVVFHSHSLIPPGPLLRLAGASLRRLRARTLANCEYTAAPWRPYSRTSVVYNGVAPCDSTPQWAGNTIACIGRIAPEKGQLDFLEAVRLASPDLPDCRFLIYGAALFNEPAVQRYDAEVRIRARDLPVEFAGWVDDVYSALATTDLLLVPSQPVEATTRVILEAYAAGVPVVAFASGGIPEVVEHRHTGLLVRSPAEMARAAVELLREPVRRARMSAAARDCWRRRFTLDRYRAEVAAALEIAARR